MVRKSKWLFLLFLLPALAVGAENSGANMFDLPNGLKIIFYPQRNVEATAVCLYYLNGSRNDPPDMPGVAYFFQDLMFQGTANFDPLDHFLFVKQKGGVINGQVNHDNSFFYQVVPATDLSIALRYESERLRSLRIEDDEVEAEKRHILASVGRMQANVSYRAQQWVLHTLLSGSVYEMPEYGDLDKIRQFSPERVRDYYKNYQNLSNLILVVCGKMDVSDLRAKVNDFFQDIPGGRRSRSSFVAVPFKERDTIYKNWAVEGLSRPFVVYGFPAPARLSVDYFYFAFIRAYLAGELISQLQYILNQLRNLDVEIHTTLTEFFEDNALLIEMSAPDRLTLEAAKIQFSQVIQELQTLPINGNDRSKIKNFMEVGFFKQLEAPELMAQKIAEYYHMFGGLDFLTAYLNRIRKIDAYDIMNITRKYMKKGAQVVLNVYEKK